MAQPQDAYGWGKLITERLCSDYSEDYGIEPASGGFTISSVRWAPGTVAGRKRSWVAQADAVGLREPLNLGQERMVTTSWLIWSRQSQESASRKSMCQDRKGCVGGTPTTRCYVKFWAGNRALR
jgi:hypothetical protein